MSETVPMKIIARIHTDFGSKFGVPRQSGLVPELRARIVFEPEFRSRDAVRGLADWSHIWLIWQFSEAVRDDWSPTVRPPRLGGNVRLGVFATRSPFRPNAVGLSCVKLEGVEYSDELGPVLNVSGADLMDGTPIFDIKPYLPYADRIPDATGGFTDATQFRRLTVDISDELKAEIPAETLPALIGVLQNDPRPSYHDDPGRVYGFVFASMEIRFKVADGTLTLLSVEKEA